MPWLLIRLINLVKHAAISEMRLLRLLPVAGDFRQREQFYLGELARILLGYFRRPRPVVTLRRNFLPFRTVEVLEISLCNGTRASLVHNFVDDADGGLAENAHRRHHDVELVLAQ